MVYQESVIEFSKIIFNKCLAVLLMILLIVFGFSQLITLLPLVYLSRMFVVLLCKIVRPDLGKILSSISSSLATDKITKRPNCSILLYSRVKGPVDIEAFKTKILNEVIGVRKVCDQLKNIELKQYPYKWMGFIFWKNDEKFDISNHIKYYNNDETNPESKISLSRVKEIEHELLFKPFSQNRSPWELLIFPNVESDAGENDTVLLCRIHHSIGDGFSLLKLLCFEVFDSLSNEDALPKLVPSPKQNWMQRITFWMKFLKLPYECAQIILESSDKNDWIIPPKKISQNWNSAVSEQIPMSLVKDVKNVCNSSVTAIIVAGLTAVFRQAMLQKNGKVPKYIHIGFAFPVKNHPEKLRNHLTTGIIRLPVGEPDSGKRLKEIEKSLQKLKNSALPLATYVILVIGGWMFHWITTLLSKVPIKFTALGSSFPGPKTKLTIFGTEIVDSYYMIGPLNNFTCVTFTTLTYNEFFTLWLNVNESVLSSKEEVDEMALNFSRELEILKNCGSSAVV